MNHPRHVEGYNGSIEELAKAIGIMTYDQVALLVEKLSEDLTRQATGDMLKGRKLLFQQLSEATVLMTAASERLKKAWEICEPFMEGDKSAG